MSDTPPTDDKRDDLEALYRNSSAHSPTRPSAKVRRAILEHAAKLVTDRPQTTGSARTRWRRTALLGSLAAAALAGLLIGPQFLTPSAPPSALRGPQTAPPSVAKNLPVTEPARPLVKSETQVAPSAAGAASANPERRDFAISEPAAPPAAGAAVRVTGMRARLEPDATVADAAAERRRGMDRGVSAASKALLDAAGPIDARDAEGRTALMRAVLQGRLDSVVALLRRGADPNVADSVGMTPLQAAQANERPEIVEALRRAGAR